MFFFKIRTSSFHQFLSVRVLHQREPEPLLPEILYGSSDQIDSIIDYQKPVVGLGECPDLDRRILCVVLISFTISLTQRV